MAKSEMEEKLFLMDILSGIRGTILLTDDCPGHWRIMKRKLTAIKRAFI
jgi:hypothetical protein